MVLQIYVRVPKPLPYRVRPQSRNPPAPSIVGNRAFPQKKFQQGWDSNPDVQSTMA